MQTHIDLQFADGTYRFRLPLPQINELQRKTGKGIGKLFATVLRGRYVLEGEAFGSPGEADFAMSDILEPIRQGLIGGRTAWLDGEEIAVTDAMVEPLLQTYVYPARPIIDAWALAASILMACVEGYDEPDKKKAVTAKPSRKRKPPMETGSSTMPEPLET